MNIYGVNVGQGLPRDKFEEMLSYTAKDKEARIKRFHFYEDALRALFSDLLIRSVIINTYNIDNSEITFNQNEYGKPFVSNLRGFHYNISHSGNWIVCITDEAETGIDIEQIKPIELELAKRFFAPNEFKDLISKPESKRIGYFYDLWTLKESYIKACGRGLSIPLDSFEFKIDHESIALSTKNNKNSFYFKQYEIDANYKLSACSTHNRFPDKIAIKSINDIYKSIQMKR